MPDATVECPDCGAQIELDDTLIWVRCPSCRRNVNAAAQLAFARAEALFEEGQEAGLTALEPVGRRGPRRQRQDDPERRAALRLFQQACSGLQLAFLSDLPEPKRVAGIEMMAEITQVLARHGGLPSLEATYWVKLLVEENSLREYEELVQIERNDVPRGPLGYLRHWRRALRRDQLRRGLRRLDQQIRDAEQALDLVDPLHARRRRE